MLNIHCFFFYIFCFRCEKFGLRRSFGRLDLVSTLYGQVIGNQQPLSNEELSGLIGEIQQTFASPDEVKTLLESITEL